MRLIHLTDPHLTTPPPWQSLFGRSHSGKRFLGYASWARKRRFSLRRAWLDELTAEVARLAPDQLLITGDLTQIGTAEEIAEARDWLTQLQVPGKISFVPGNHDSYAAESWPTLYREWSDFLPEAGAGGFPTVRRLGDVAIFGLSSAVPTRPLSACGLIGDAQLARFEQTLAEHRDAFRFLLLHHPPLPDMISFRKRLRDAPALAEMLSREPVDVILHGHRHTNQSSERQGAKVYCTAPASAEAGSFRVFDLEPVASGWQVQMSLRQRSVDGQRLAFETVESADWVVSGPG